MLKGSPANIRAGHSDHPCGFSRGLSVRGTRAPRKICIGTGDPSGAYYAFAQRYRETLAREGITLEIRNTAGSAENIKLLEAKEGGVDIAFVQGGIGDPAAQPGLRSLCSLYFEPLWVFYHRSLQVRRLPDLRGKRIAAASKRAG